MRLTVLGSGTSVPHPQRAASAFWLEVNSGTGNAQSLLLDVGADTVHRVAQENLDWPALDAIWISHFHLDHIGGLAPLLFGTKYAPQTQVRQKPLTIFGPPGLQRLLSAFEQSNNYGLQQQPFPLRVREVAPGGAFNILPNLHAQVFSTPHTDESLALKLTAQGLTNQGLTDSGLTDSGLTDQRNRSQLVYTSDTGYTEELAAFACDAQLLITEASFWQVTPVATHQTLADAMRLTRLAAPQRTVLTHFYPEWDEVDIVAEAQKHWSGETIAAYDGLQLEIPAHKD